MSQVTGHKLVFSSQPMYLKGLRHNRGWEPAKVQIKEEVNILKGLRWNHRCDVAKNLKGYVPTAVATQHFCVDNIQNYQCCKRHVAKLDIPSSQHKKK